MTSGGAYVDKRSGVRPYGSEKCRKEKAGQAPGPGPDKGEREIFPVRQIFFSCCNERDFLWNLTRINVTIPAVMRITIPTITSAYCWITPESEFVTITGRGGGPYTGVEEKSALTGATTRERISPKRPGAPGRKRENGRFFHHSIYSYKNTRDKWLMAGSLGKRIKTRALVTGFCTMRDLGKTLPPKTVIWECTRACNMACIHCGSGEPGPACNELSTEQISGIVRELGSMGVRRFLATGGEPLLRPDLLDVMEQAKACGLETGFSTNGAGISEENIARIVRAADSIQVSVDGTQTTHDTLRTCPGAFTGALRALDLLRGHHCRQACMTSIVSPFNIHELDELYRLATAHADIWRIGTVMPIGRAGNNKALFLSGGELRSLLAFTSAKMKGRFPVIIGENLGYLGDEYDNTIHRHDFFFCGIGTLSCCIGADGMVRGCPDAAGSGVYRR